MYGIMYDNIIIDKMLLFSKDGSDSVECCRKLDLRDKYIYYVCELPEIYLYGLIRPAVISACQTAC